MGPQWTPLAVAASIQPACSCTAMDRDAAREDGPSAMSSTKSLTWAAEVCRVSSSTFASHRAASSTPKQSGGLVQTIGQSSSLSRPQGGRSSEQSLRHPREQRLMPHHSMPPLWIPSPVPPSLLGWSGLLHP
jgi:hypothetical protein